MYINVTHEQGLGEKCIWRDNRVSLKAKGFWFTLWYHYDDNPEKQERFSVARFVNAYLADGVDSASSAFNELKYFKYVKVEGHGTASKYTIFDFTEV